MCTGWTWALSWRLRIQNKSTAERKQQMLFGHKGWCFKNYGLSTKVGHPTFKDGHCQLQNSEHQILTAWSQVLFFFILFKGRLGSILIALRCPERETFLWKLTQTSNLESQTPAQHTVLPAGLQSKLPMFRQAVMKYINMYGWGPRHVLTLADLHFHIKPGLTRSAWCNEKLNKLSRETNNTWACTTGKTTSKMQ